MRNRLLTRTCLAVMLALFAVPLARATVTLNSANFPDAAFRAAVATAAGGINDGDSFNETAITMLDVSGMGITDLTGVERLTALTKLVASDNDIQFVKLTGNTHLEWLDLSCNEDLLGFSVNTATASNHYINLTPSSTPMPLTHLDLSNCDIGYFQALSNTYGVTTLTWLSLANNTRMAGWSSGIAAQTNLVYCDLTNTGQTSTSLGFTSSHNKIETLILKNNSSFGYSSTIQYLSALKYLDISNCDIYFREGSSPYYLLHYLTPSNNPNLETLLVSNSKMGTNTQGLTGFQKLKKVDVSGNASMTQFWVNQCPMIDTLNITGCTGLTYLNLIDNGLPRNSFALITNSTTYSSLLTSSLNDNNYGSVGRAMSDLSGINSLQNLYLESNSGFNGLDYTMAAADCGGLHGLDLDCNEFKSFAADSLPSTLTTLLLGNCPYLESVEIHKAVGLTSLGTTNGLGSSTGVGLYLLGDPLLTHLDLGNIYNPFNAGAVNNLTTLTYLDLTNTGQATNGINFNGMTSLDTLILNSNSSYGYSSSIQYLSALKYLDISNCDIFFREGNSTDGYYLLHYLTPTNNPNLETLLASNSKLGTRTQGLTGFSNLKTVDVSYNTTSGTVNMTQFWVNDCPKLETLDISGNTALTYLELNNDSLPRNNFTLIGGNDCTALQSLYLNGNRYGTVGAVRSDFSSLGSLAYLYMENNSGFTGGPLTIEENDCAGLTGLDLGNNNFTSFHAASLPSSLTALMLGDNPSMTHLEMHHNPGITAMTDNPTMSDGSGLYLLGNSALHYLDISGTAEQANYFQRIGNNFSLQGVPIDTIKASYNKFYTFRNLNTVPGGQYEACNRDNYAYSMSATLPNQKYFYSAYWPTMAARPDSASLEQLTGLKYLDLSHCQLKDSLYLHKNTELRYLDVSHNRTITRYATSPDKGKGYRDSGGSMSVTNRDYEDYKKYLWLADTRTRYPYRQQAYDQEYYTMDYNDTTGLYILDLMDNDQLEYLDISYTGIQQTALTHCHVSNARFIWIQDLHKLKYFYADYNGMRSMGIGTLNGKHHQEALKSLERLSAIGMRGADITTMQGSINFLNNGKNPNLHYVNVSYSDYDSIGVKNPKIDTLIIRGNPIHHLNVQDAENITYIDARECAFKERGYDPETNLTVAIPDTLTLRMRWTNYDTGVTKDSIRLITMNGARSPGNYLGELKTPYSGLRTIQAHHRPHLTTLLVNNCNALTDVYCHFDPLLTGITGFDDLAYPKDSVDLALGYGADADTLNLVWVNDDYSLIDLNLTKNDNLRYLHAYNDKALGRALAGNGLDLGNNHKMIKVWVSNSCLERFVNGTGADLDTLWIWDNPKLSELNVTSNTGLKTLDLRNCRVRYLDMHACDSLVYFDCSNDSIQGFYDAEDWFGCELPRAVPVPDNIDMDNDGKNRIADLLFSSKKLEVVKADNNDLFSLKGLRGNSGLKTLTYSYNHINGIDLNGCDSIIDYDCTHNGRGVIPGEMAAWTGRGETGDTIFYSMYYLQLVENAGDALRPNYSTFLGDKIGEDSLEVKGTTPYQRMLKLDGFEADSVIQFVVNSSGPFKGTRGQNNGQTLTSSYVDYGPGTIPDSTKIYGRVALLNKYDETRNYIRYAYSDGRRTSSRDGNGRGESTFYLVWSAPDEPTSVDETQEDGLQQPTVVSERYFDVGGAEHSEPFDGVNIVVRQMSDGSTQTVKIIR